MYKKIYKVIINIFILFLFNTVNAQEMKIVDINKWSFKTLTSRADQDNKVIISKYYNVDDRSKYGFCLEPNQDFLPVGSIYYEEDFINENINNIVKVYNSIGLDDDNYYIAAQLLIWEELYSNSYTFNSNDYSTYKNEILNYLNNNEEINLNNNINKTYESKINEIVTINDNFTNYDINADGIEIIELNENRLLYKIIDEYPINKKIEFIPKEDLDKDIIYKSDTSQDIYIHEGNFLNLEPFTIDVITLIDPEFIDIKYSKKDTKGNILDNTEFTLYEINDKYEDEIVFIHINNYIDIFEALLEDKSLYNNLNIEISERYRKYIKNNIINTPEIGYFPYSIYNDNTLIKQGKVFVTDDASQSNNSYSRIKTKAIFRGFSENLSVNSINNIEKNKLYYLCETEPKKGYTYLNKPCVLIDTSIYNQETIEFINDNRLFSLKLIKNNTDNLFLNGAHFLVNIDGEDKEYITGTLKINRENDYKYLIYKNTKNNEIGIIEFNNDYVLLNNIETGKYLYYQSNSNEISHNSFTNEVNFINGGFIIDDIPYNSSISIQETMAPKGYIIDNNIYNIDPDLNYSDLTLTNYRVNEMTIIPPEKKFNIPQTCIDD